MEVDRASQLITLQCRTCFSVAEDAFHLAEFLGNRSDFEEALTSRDRQVSIAEVMDPLLLGSGNEVPTPSRTKHTTHVLSSCNTWRTPPGAGRYQRSIPVTTISVYADATIDTFQGCGMGGYTDLLQVRRDTVRNRVHACCAGEIVVEIRI